MSVSRTGNKNGPRITFGDLDACEQVPDIEHLYNNSQL